MNRLTKTLILSLWIFCAACSATDFQTIVKFDQPLNSQQEKALKAMLTKSTQHFELLASSRDDRWVMRYHLKSGVSNDSLLTQLSELSYVKYAVEDSVMKQQTPLSN